MSTDFYRFFFSDDGQQHFLSDKPSDSMLEGYSEFWTTQGEALTALLQIQPASPHDTSCWGLRKWSKNGEPIRFDRLGDEKPMGDMAALLLEEYSFFITIPEWRETLKDFPFESGKCFLLHVGTGCTCCNDQDYWVGPFLNKASAESEIERLKEHPPLRSQYAEQGSYYIREVDYEIGYMGRDKRPIILIDGQYAFNREEYDFQELNGYSWSDQLDRLPRYIGRG